MSRAHIEAPRELAPLLSDLKRRLFPLDLWLFGSRARGEARVDSDWDLVAVVADAAPDSQTDPITAFEIGRMAEVPVTLLVTRQSDLAAIWGLPNTIGYDLAREGIRLRVG